MPPPPERRVLAAKRPAPGRGARQAAFRLGALAVLVLGLLACARNPARPEPVASPARIGYVAGGSRDVPEDPARYLREGLEQYGYHEGKNIVIEYRYANGQYDDLPHLIDELLRL